MIGTLFPLVALMGAIGWNLTCRINDRRLAVQVAHAFEMPANPALVDDQAAREAEQWQLTTAA
jgi:hypothetical protein